jgi:hypothetical protein
MEEISKLCWLIGFDKHTIWANSLYFLYLPLVSTCKILGFIPASPTTFINMIGQLRFFYKTLFEIVPMFQEIHG